YPVCVSYLPYGLLRSTSPEVLSPSSSHPYSPRVVRARGASVMTIVLLACAAIGTTGARADLPQPVTTAAPMRANEPVVLTGSLFPDWSAGPELTFRASQVPVDYGVADSQGLQPAYLRSDCYVANPPP